MTEKKKLLLYISLYFAVIAAVTIVAIVTRGPEKIVEQTKTTQDQQTKLEQRDYSAEFAQVQSQLRELTKQVTDFNQKKNVVTTKKTVKLPDGTVTTDEKSEDKTETNRHIEIDKQLQYDLAAQVMTLHEKTTSLEQTLHLTEEKLRISESLQRPEWLFGLAGGVSVPALLGKDAGPSLFSLPGPVVIQGSAQKHLFWKLYGGVILNTRGEILLGLTGGR